MRGNGGCAPVPGNVGLPPNNYGENHFMVTHQNGIIQLKLKDGIEWVLLKNLILACNEEEQKQLNGESYFIS